MAGSFPCLIQHIWVLPKHRISFEVLRVSVAGTTLLNMQPCLSFFRKGYAQRYYPEFPAPWTCSKETQVSHKMTNTFIIPGYYFQNHLSKYKLSELFNQITAKEQQVCVIFSLAVPAWQRSSHHQVLLRSSLGRTAAEICKEQLKSMRRDT